MRDSPFDRHYRMSGLGRFFRAQYAREKLLADAEVATKLCQWPRGRYHGELPARASLKGADLTDTNLTQEQFDSAAAAEGATIAAT
jgi:hypothetical protein